VAVKTIKKVKIETEQDLIRIRREIQIMSSIQHPHIIHIYEVFENKDKIVLVMQFASGGELYDYLSEKKVLSDVEARRIFRQIAAAVYYCHKNKICHRDLKLENILLDEKGNAKIADFGLSNVFDEKNLLKTYCGSPLYASPEIVKGVPYYGPEVDCWSMGVLLYTLVYGAMPFDGSNFKKLVTQISEGDYFEPKKKSNASELIKKLLTVNPSKRATIVDICTDYWVNLGYEHSLLQVAEDMANLTPVRLDLLLALAPDSMVPQEEIELEQFGSSVDAMNKDFDREIPDEEDEEDEECNPDTAANSFAFMKGSHASQLSISSPNLQEAVDDEEVSESDFLPADIAAALHAEGAKRLAESSFGANLARISSLVHRNKKPRKSDSSNLNNQISEKADTQKKIEDKLRSSTSLNKMSKDNISSEELNNNVKQSEEKKLSKSEVKDTSNTKSEKTTTVSPSNSQNVDNLKQNAEVEELKQVLRRESVSGSKIPETSFVNQVKESLTSTDEKVDVKKIGRPPGKIIIPKTFDSPQTTPSPKLNINKKFIKSESRSDSQDGEQKETVPPSEGVEQKCGEKPKSPVGEDVNKNVISLDTNSETKTAVITEEKKNIAKGILKKGIAKAKLAERKMSKQGSIESDISSPCSTPVSTVGTPEPAPSFYKTPKPYSKEEETSVKSKAEIKLSSTQSSTSTLKNGSSSCQNAPLWDSALRPSDRQLPDKNVNWSAISSTIDSEMSSWREQMEESLRRLSPDDERSSNQSYPLSKAEDDKPLVPIARSYKKFTFTKDGACITETKKIYTTPGADGSWTKVEKKTKITTRPGNAEEFEKFRDLHLRNDSPLTRSDSQSSSGSNDIYDDIFDSWTGDTMMCNMRKMSNMFQKFSRDPFLRKERRRNPFRYFRRTESERNEREKKMYEIRSGRSTDRESSENEEDYDVHYDDSSAVVYGSQGLWQFLRSANRGFPGRVTIHHEPISYGRSVSQDRSESKFDANWKRTGSRASSGYNTGTRSQSRDRTESPREKVLRFVFESPKEGFSRESNIKDSPSRHEKWSMKRNLGRQHPRRDSGVGSDGYESEYSVRHSPSDELSRTGRVSSMSSICSSSKQDMIRNFMRSWSKDLMSPPLSPTSLGSAKEQFENLPDGRKHRVEQWLHMNSEAPFDFYNDCHSGIASRKSSTSHSNNSSAYATMRPREYLRYNRSSSDKLGECDADYFPAFDENPRGRSHSLNKEPSFGEMNKIRFRTAAYSPVSEESSKETQSVHHSESSHSASSVHRINFTFSDGRVSSSHNSPQPPTNYARQVSSTKDGCVTLESTSPTNVKFEQVSARAPGQPLVQMRVSFNRGNRENQVIHVTAQPPQISKGLWEQQESVRTSKQDGSFSVTREVSPVPGIRQFSTEVQHPIGISEQAPRSTPEYEMRNTGKDSPHSPPTGKHSPYTSHLPPESSIWDMACVPPCMENDTDLANISMNIHQIKQNDNFNYICDKSYSSRPKQFLPLKTEFDSDKSCVLESQTSVSNGANTPDSLEDLDIEQSLLVENNMIMNDSIISNALDSNVETKSMSEFHLEVKPLGTLWNNSNSQHSASVRKQEDDAYVTFTQLQSFTNQDKCSDGLETPDLQRKCIENTSSEIGSIWNQKTACQTFDLLKNLLSDDGLESFSSSKCVLNSSHSGVNQNNPEDMTNSENCLGQNSLKEKHLSVIDNIELERLTRGEKFHKVVPSLMDDLQSPKEVLRQAMKICDSFDHFE
ncbi:uncharacterized protein LOC118193974, partial [Stegodyphus dumicola]|uniref:uncharacterized protein LOC118193974 n=1 Tax=Stegodyphus dumicola TaxID=202533 RepID=UPI0015AD19E0